MVIMSAYKNWLPEKLKHMEAKVTFIKRDGTERVMKCTLKENVAPEYEKKTERQSNDEICFVWDLDKQEWRSFRFDSIKQVEFGAI